jgi:AraC-like DNA-binding protein
LSNERSWGGRLYADHIPGGVMMKLGECSCRYIEDIREHAALQLMHREDTRIEKK